MPPPLSHTTDDGAARARLAGWEQQTSWKKASYLEHAVDLGPSGRRDGAVGAADDARAQRLGQPARVADGVYRLADLEVGRRADGYGRRQRLRRAGVGAATAVAAAAGADDLAGP